MGEEKKIWYNLFKYVIFLFRDVKGQYDTFQV